MNGECLLVVENLKIGFSGNNRVSEVVQGISFRIKPGETLGLVGESGSGKSLTGLSLLQLTPLAAVVSGKVLFQRKEGKPIDLLSANERIIRRIRGRDISMVFQEPHSSLNPVFTCGEQIREAIENHGLTTGKQAKERSLDWLVKVGLENPLRIYNSYPHQVSGGQLQRVMIAMALCTAPALLIADEPTTALDVHIQMHILELLNTLKEELGLAMLFISHDLGVISEIADRVAVLDRGVLVEENEIRSIFSNPANKVTRQLLASRPALDKKMNRLPSESYIPATEKTPEFKVNAKHEECLLEVAGLEVVYRSGGSWFSKKELTRAVNQVSFQLFRGETLGIAGASGSGKTTLGKSLVKLVEPEAGTIDLAENLESSIQYIFQDPWNSLNPTLEVGEAIREVIALMNPNLPRESQVKRTIQYLEKVGLLADHYHRYPAEFSGGQRQRISIARALAAEPEILICDEVVSALDVSIQAQILNLLKDLQDDLGLSYIFISHDLAVLRFMADNLIVMKEGRIVESGESEAVFRSPSNSYTRELLAAVPGKFLQ